MRYFYSDTYDAVMPSTTGRSTKHWT